MEETKMEEKPTAVVQTMKEKNPAEYLRLKGLRRERRQRRLNGLKKLGHKPNAKLSKDKKTGADLKSVVL